MIHKNRVYYIGNDKMNGTDFRFIVRYNQKIGEPCLCRLAFLSYEWFSIEELEDMLAILKKIKKETREDKLK